MTRNQIQRGLNTMFESLRFRVDLKLDWDRFDFTRWESRLWSAIVRMGERLNTFGPVSRIGTVMQEYLEPTDFRGPRIDLDNRRGTNLLPVMERTVKELDYLQGG